MVTITNVTTKNLRRRNSSGNVITICAGETIELKGRHWENPALLEQFKSYAFKINKGKSTKKVGGGIKTHVKPSKPRGRPSKSQTQKKVDKLITEPPKKGLKKSKKGKAK